jgi:2-C-methyl-D-erythritol 4-phosphate cytidylyltransferase
MTKNWAVIVAAGSGSRFSADSPKQYQMLQGRTVLEHSIAAFSNSDFFAGIILVLAEGDDYISDVKLPCIVTIVTGGKERSDSVANGLSALTDKASEDDWIWIHDGARPCVGNNFLAELALELGEHAVGGIPAIPVTDTIKTASNNKILTTEPRVNLWRAQTPQIFRFQLIARAMAAAIENDNEITDESSAVEQLGLKPLLLTGRDSNIKITRQQDLSLADYYLINKVERPDV